MGTFFFRLRRWFWRFMVIFSFIVNVVLVIVVAALLLLIFDIKANIAEPLVGGLHRSFVGLDQATIDWTIPVRDRIPVVMTVPLETNTTVVLTAPVPLDVSASIDLPGLNARGAAAQVRLVLPAGLALPVSLDLDVPINEQLDVALDVRAVIPLQGTQLHDVAESLRLLFEPFVRGLDNLPSDFGETLTLVGDLLSNNPPDLMHQPDDAPNPWPGFSQTAGLNYDMFDEPWPLSNRPVQTGIVVQGGVPTLDEQVRPDVRAAGGVEDINSRARQNMESRYIPPQFYDGTLGKYIVALRDGGFTIQSPPAASLTAGQNPDGALAAPAQHAPPPADLGIVPTAQPGGGG